MAARLLQRSVSFSRYLKRGFANVNIAAVPLTESLPGYDELEQTQTEAKQEPVMVSSLSNGVKIASKEVSNSPYVSLGVFVKCGSRVEPYHKLGLSHLLRHCAFLSTEEKSSYLLMREIQHLGGSLSCNITREHAVYNVTFLKGDQEHIIASLCDRIASSSFRHYEVDEQKEYLKLNIAESNENPNTVVNEGLHKISFRNGLCNSLYSPSYNVDKFTYEDLGGFVRDWFIGSNVSVVGVGMDHNSLLKCVKPLNQLSETSGLAIAKSAYVGGGELRVDSGSPLAHVGIVCKGTSLNGPSESIAGVVQCLLGSGQRLKWGSGSASARLNKAVARKIDDKFDINAINIRYSDNGLFGFYAKANGSIMGQVLQLAMAEFSEISKGNVDEADLTRAKNQYKADLLMSCDLVNDIGQQVSFTSKYTDISEKIKEIDSITSQDVIGFVKSVFATRPNVVSCGNLSTVPRLDELLTNLS